MLNWIEVDVVHMAIKIVFISNRVFPKAPLPQAVLTARIFRHLNALFFNQASKPVLDTPPSSGVIRISYGQGPYSVQVLRQNDNCIDGKGALASSIAQSPSQKIDMLYQEF